MKWLFISTVVLLILVFSNCSSSEAVNNKDLDENMIDMMMYHDNLGLYLRKKDADYALWLLQGMDSSLQVISSKFVTHRKLNVPFNESYQKKLLPSISSMKAALEQKNFPSAIQAYQTLTRKCNGCHADHDVEKEVVDRSAAEGH